jgi:hypothetical protein
MLIRVGIPTFSSFSENVPDGHFLPVETLQVRILCVNLQPYDIFLSVCYQLANIINNISTESEFKFTLSHHFKFRKDDDASFSRRYKQCQKDTSH